MTETKLVGVDVGGTFTDLVVVGPSDPAAMLRHSQECREHGYPFAADPSQQLSSLDGEAITQLVNGAAYLFTNTYERGLLEHKTGWGDDDILARIELELRSRIGRDHQLRGKVAEADVLGERSVDQLFDDDGVDHWMAQRGAQSAPTSLFGPGLSAFEKIAASCPRGNGRLPLLL